MPQCVSCGRGDLLHAQIRTYQCLACGAVMDEQQNVLPTQDKGPNLSNAGLPVKELGEPAEVVLAPVVPEAPVEAVETPEPEVAPEIVAPIIDLSSLTPEQLAEIQAIVNEVPDTVGGVDGGEETDQDKPSEQG